MSHRALLGLTMALWLAQPASAAEPGFLAFESRAGWNTLLSRPDGEPPMHISRKKVEGVSCFQAVSRTKSSIETLVGIVTNMDDALSWSSVELHSSRILARGPGWWTYVQHLDIPTWTLVRDRFWIVTGRLTRESDGSARLRWTRVDAATVYPEIHARLTGELDSVETPLNMGEWVFRPDGEVRYHVCADSGGMLPDFLQRSATRRTLPDNVDALLTEAARREASALADVP